MDAEKEGFVVRIPVVDILKIVQGANYQSSDEESVTPESAIGELMKPWAVVARDVDGTHFTQGFDDQKTCAARVASFYNTEYEVVHVLKNGIPRKNITVEVKARFR